jgi:hypothetical protein
MLRSQVAVWLLTPARRSERSALQCSLGLLAGDDVVTRLYVGLVDLVSVSLISWARACSAWLAIACSVRPARPRAQPISARWS